MTTDRAVRRGLPGELRLFRQRVAEVALRDTNIVVASVVFNNLLRAVSSVILTRLLVPEVFGIAGLIGAISFSLGLMSDLGFQAFVVRHPDGDKSRFLDTVWTIALIRSVVLTLLLIALAQPIAVMMGTPELAPIIAASSCTFLIEGVASLTLLTALRRGMILRLSLLEVGVAVFQLAVAVVLAYFWRNYWALLASMLIGSALKSLLSYLCFPDALRRLAFDRQYIKELWGFARFVTGSSIITVVLVQCDKFVLAAVMPLEEFGLYILAGNLASAPLAFASAYASRVLYPCYSRAWREGAGELRNLFYAKRWLPTLLYTFAAGGLVGSAPLIIAILYDPRYSGAALYLQLLAISPLFALASNSANEALTATGRIQVTFHASIVKLLWLAIAGPVAIVVWREIGLVAAVGLMEPAAVLFKWIQLRRAQLLDIRKEAVFLLAGATGVMTGVMGARLLGWAYGG